jgi:hypothetical protein
MLPSTASRVAKAVLIAAFPALMLKTWRSFPPVSARIQCRFIGLRGKMWVP